MIEHLKTGLRFIFSHKLKYLVFLITFILFLLWRFPLQDVGDLVGAQVSQATGNQVFVQFDRLNLGLFPSLSVGADNFTIETPLIPAVTASEIQIKPSLGGLILQKPEGEIDARGIFKGDVVVTLHAGRKTDQGIQTQLLSVKAESLSLAEINKVAELPLLLKGKLNLTTSGSVDPSFTEQPDFDVEMKIDKLEIPSAMVNTMMGPLNLPELRLSAVEIKGRLSAGRLNIEKGLIGQAGDELHGTLKGGISLVIQNRGGNPAPILGAYNFEIDLTATKPFQDKAALFLSFLDNYKSVTPTGTRYQFKVNATSPQMPPSMSALR